MKVGGEGGAQGDVFIGKITLAAVWEVAGRLLRVLVGFYVVFSCGTREMVIDMCDI